MLKQRIITAMVLLPLALCGFFLLSGLSFALFIGLVVTLAAWEWARLAGYQGQAVRIAYALLVALGLVVLYRLPLLAPWVMAASLLWWLAAIFLVFGYPGSQRFWGGRLGSLVIGLLVLLPAWQGLLLLKQWSVAGWLILAVMVLVWVADIGAYFSGKAFGRRKLAPAVSPGKSWEGLLGGLLASLALTLAVAIHSAWPVSRVLAALLVCAIVVLISVIGDLTESMFKRSAGIKDSSQLLPGHGGVMDRIDSLTAAVPVFVVLFWLLERSVW
ncbi:phosphatidate cytidylyltransferase [Stutzerimonas kirkiae]|uniref:Phosphatidate cytidylyltransferase n=1 Tax=Stutzerimonas kirkiae TaxID=2211392 RepID=A0A4Q9R656_9GAMM|nr:phosphatidate cytidylyltransferase [Stutzerimonas kirkiae]TBU95510.1 phosphatidate cytidylyltransferase [Stutzerimonas kirkiae]TBV02548.1 phosphatidate cytidylyltransferase [Stutzerimonas kirkiae]TBV09215.1 phosphatidate cytidylyltransferase [Stutzerimonas kirkiae]TBV12194.1 phosphatidate cytidylyltransferase [Stutzerimonas kirkiae]